jgi:hypothetical protein
MVFFPVVGSVLHSKTTFRKIKPDRNRLSACCKAEKARAARKFPQA